MSCIYVLVNRFIITKTERKTIHFRYTVDRRDSMSLSNTCVRGVISEYCCIK